MLLRSRNRTLLLENWYHAFRENRESVFIIIVRFMMSANSRIHFGLNIVFVYLYITPSHYHHCASIFENIELIKMPVRYIFSCVWVRKNTFSQLPIIQCVVLCVFSLPISLVMTDRIYILVLLSSSKEWVLPIVYVCAVCLSIFLSIAW